PLAVSVEENLGVRAGTERIPAPAQLVAQLDVVVYLAVEGDDERPVGARHRLPTLREVDDRQAPVSQEETVVVPVGPLVRPPVPQVVDQPREEAVGIDRPRPREAA